MPCQAVAHGGKIYGRRLPLPAKRLTGHAVFVAIQRPDPAGSEIEFSLLTIGHVPAGVFIPAGEIPAGLDRW